MKNILKSPAVAALMFISLTSMAFEPSTSLTKGNYIISVKDGKKVYYQKVSVD